MLINFSVHLVIAPKCYWGHQLVDRIQYDCPFNFETGCRHFSFHGPICQQIYSITIKDADHKSDVISCTGYLLTSEKSNHNPQANNK